MIGIVVGCESMLKEDKIIMVNKINGMVASAMVLGAVVSCGAEYENAAASLYAGWYVASGVSYNYTKGDVVISDNRAILLGGVRNGPVGACSLLKTSVGRTGAALALGYGAFFSGSCYFGGELGLDITGGRQTCQKSAFGVADYGTTRVKTRGLLPTVAFRLGGYVEPLDCMLYARVGLTFLNNKFENSCFPGQGFGSEKFSPIVGLGVEKTISDGCSMRIEGDYRFSADKTKNGLRTNLLGLNAAQQALYKATIKNRVRGYAVRVLFVYRF